MMVSNMYRNLLYEMLSQVQQLKASDLHIVTGTHPALRVNGEIILLTHLPILRREDTKGLAQYICEEILEYSLRGQLELDCAFGLPEFGRFRLNVYRSQGDYALAIRSLPLDIRSFEELGIPVSLKQLAYKTNGLVLVTGPTGSGKSTTLAAILDLINRERSLHIITIEDPIEYIYDHKKSIVTQREIGADSNSFADALRAAMREDPDVILVGEMRDAETVQIALTAAETGHLVFSTLHTLGAAKTIDRIVDNFEAERQNQIRSQLATVLQGVISQVLIPKLDNSGRVLACEIMFSTPAIRNLIREGKPHQIANVMQTNKNLDMCLLDTELIRLYRAHVISAEEAISRAQQIDSVRNAIGGNI